MMMSKTKVKALGNPSARRLQENHERDQPVFMESVSLDRAVQASSSGSPGWMLRWTNTAQESRLYLERSQPSGI
jgi:hypothetical protein